MDAPMNHHSTTSDSSSSIQVSPATSPPVGIPIASPSPLSSPLTSLDFSRIETNSPVAVPASKSDLPPLIAEYGSFATTVWLEERHHIWRSPPSCPSSPQIYSYLPAGRYYMAWGSPLCKPSFLRTTAEEFAGFCKRERKRPVWTCIEDELETILAEGIAGREWSSLTCITENIVRPELTDFKKKDLAHNLRRATAAGVKVLELKLHPPSWLPRESIREEVERGLERWKKSRTSEQQVASASLHPWTDAHHRRYWLAKVGEKIVGICILTPLRNDSFAVKNAISFPEAPKGTSEQLLGEVLDQMRLEERNTISFGTSASNDITPTHNLGGWKIKLLRKTYRRVVKKHDLAHRGTFRAKFGTEDVPLYIAYPRNGFGIDGPFSLMSLLRAD